MDKSGTQWKVESGITNLITGKTNLKQIENVLFIQNNLTFHQITNQIVLPLFILDWKQLLRDDGAFRYLVINYDNTEGTKMLLLSEEISI